MVAPNPLYLAESGSSLIGSTSDPLLTAINTDLFTGTVNGWFDAGAYNTMYLQILGGATITAGAVTLECTNDPSNTAGQPLAARGVGSPSNAPFVSVITVTSAFASIYQLNLSARYVRARISTAFTGATTGARVIAMLEEQVSPYDLGLQNVSVVGTPAVSISGTGNVNLISTTAPSVYTLNSAATTNLVNVKASAGRMYFIGLSNQNAAARFFKLYNKASAPVPGTDIPVMVIPVAASSSQMIELGVFGAQFTIGIAIAVTGAAGDADATAITAGDFKVNLQYV